MSGSGRGWDVGIAAISISLSYQHGGRADAAAVGIKGNGIGIVPMRIEGEAAALRNGDKGILCDLLAAVSQGIPAAENLALMQRLR